MRLTLANKIRFYLAEQKKTQASLAEYAGVSSQAVTGWLHGTKPREEKLRKIAQYLNISEQDLLFGELTYQSNSEKSNTSTCSELEEGYVVLPEHEIKLLDNNNNYEWIIKEDAKKVIFYTSWIENKKLRTNACKVLSVKGKSMEPFLLNGDIILIDSLDTEIVDGDAYALLYKGRFYIKRIYQAGDNLVLKSDNKDFHDISANSSDLEDLKILGHVVWRGG